MKLLPHNLLFGAPISNRYWYSFYKYYYGKIVHHYLRCDNSCDASKPKSWHKINDTKVDQLWHDMHSFYLSGCEIHYYYTFCDLCINLYVNLIMVSHLF